MRRLRYVGSVGLFSKCVEVKQPGTAGGQAARRRRRPFVYENRSISVDARTLFKWMDYYKAFKWIYCPYIVMKSFSLQ